MVFRISSAWTAGVATALIAVGVVCCMRVQPASAQAALQITAPVSGTRVAPGTAVTVSVSVGSGVTVSEMIVIGEDPIGLSNPLTASPLQFLITLPTNINPGLYHLTADATGSQGQDLQSAPIVIDVEPSVEITSLTVQPRIIRFRFAGDTARIRVLGALATGGQIDLTDSTMISYTSSNAAVVTVSQTGSVTAVGPGSASITVNGPAAPFAIPVFVPSSVRGDLNGDGKVNVDDLNILLSALNTQATKPVDARDLNGDGVINALDARILVTLCTLPNCATH